MKTWVRVMRAPSSIHLTRAIEGFHVPLHMHWIDEGARITLTHVFIYVPPVRCADGEFGDVHRSGAVLSHRRRFFIKTTNQFLCQIDRRWRTVSARVLQILA